MNMMMGRRGHPDRPLLFVQEPRIAHLRKPATSLSRKQTTNAEGNPNLAVPLTTSVVLVGPALRPAIIPYPQEV